MQGIPVFKPTFDEFKNFPKYIAKLEAIGAGANGLAKIVPPKEWVPRKGGYNNIDKFIIPKPIYQEAEKTNIFDVYELTATPSKSSLTVRKFRELCQKRDYATPKHDSYEELERKFWKNNKTAIYGADVRATLFDAEQQVWNFDRLDPVLSACLNEAANGGSIDGVDSSYLYFGMWRSIFGWHTEDMDLYSINYLHFGAPKTWYGIPPAYGARFDEFAAKLYAEQARSCKAFMRHKAVLIKPELLQECGIVVHKVMQQAGEIIITFPYGYHAGFNNGYNCAEATSFVTERWLDYGKRAVLCYCKPNAVRFSMEPFVRHYSKVTSAAVAEEAPQIVDLAKMSRVDEEHKQPSKETDQAKVMHLVEEPRLIRRAKEARKAVGYMVLLKMQHRRCLIPCGRSTKHQ